MFKLFSREIKIFSIPIYISILSLMVIGFNALDYSNIEIFSGLFSFAGIALGYFLFNSIGLNYQTHLPLFVYTFLVFAFYTGDLDIGIAVNLFTHSFILLILSSQEEKNFKNSIYLIVGALLAVGYLFLPTTWAMIIFVIIHLIATSDKISLNLFRLFFGFFLMLFAYLGSMYLLGYYAFNPVYIPFLPTQFLTNFYPLYFLIPVGLLLFYAIGDHFTHYNEKSPRSRFKYTFILLYTITQIITITLYMGKNYEYLLFLCLPTSIIICRGLKFMPKHWVQELSLWLLILSLITFKLSTYFSLNQIIHL